MDGDSESEDDGSDDNGQPPDAESDSECESDERTAPEDTESIAPEPQKFVIKPKAKKVTPQAAKSPKMAPEVSDIKDPETQTVPEWTKLVIKPKATKLQTVKPSYTRYLQIDQRDTTERKDTMPPPPPPPPPAPTQPAKQAAAKVRAPSYYLSLLNMIRLDPQESAEFMRKRKELLDGGLERKRKRQRS